MDLKTFALSLLESEGVKASTELVPVLRQAHAALIVLHLVQRTNHWEASGPSQYGDHQLYERLYDAAAEDMDSFAERVAGVFDPHVLAYGADLIARIETELKVHLEHKTVLERALHAERHTAEALVNAWNALKDEGLIELAPGFVDDLMPALISKREEAIYLLRQRGGEESDISPG